MSVKHIAPVVLAAGLSSRFGNDKLLHPISHQNKTKPMILHALSRWLEVFPTVNVVVRQDNLALLRLLEGCELFEQLTVIVAADADKGMSQSLIAGVKADTKADGWLVGLGDMPYLDSSVIAASLTALESGAAITVPEFRKQRGHPVGFAARFLSQLLALKGDAGARAIIQSSQELVCSIPADNEGIFHDIDSLEDIQHPGR